MKQKLSAVGLPLITLLVTAAIGVVWAIAHKTGLEAYYTDLAYRTLADIGEVFRDRVYQYDVALHNSCKDWKKEEGETCKKWENVVRLRQGLLDKVEPKTVVPRSRLVYHFGDHFGGARVQLDLQTVASQIATDFFDDLILCDDESNVLYQKSEYGRRFVKCSAILAHTPQTDARKKETASAWVLSEENPFRVFEHRVELENPHTRIAFGGAAPKDEPIHLTVLGLILQKRLESEVYAFPFTLSFTFIFVVFVAFFSIPMVRVSLLRPNQRLRRWDGAWLTASTFFTASLVTFGLLVLVYYRLEAEQGIDLRLEKIAQQVEENAGKEFKDQRVVLANVMGAAANLCRESSASPKPVLCPGLVESGGAGTLGRFVSPHNFDPTIDLVSFTGLDGMQTAKWTMKPETPRSLIEVKDRDFFQAVVAHRTWRFKSDPFYLEALVSRTTAENVVVQSIPGPGMVLNLTSRPASLFGVFMQPGFGFAIINRDGEILFHSEQSRNLHENLFHDCMDTAELKSAVHGRSIRTFDANYLGRDHRFHITPLKSFVGSPWTLVTFYDREQSRSTLAGVITVTLALYLAYTVLAALVLAIVVTLGFVRNVSLSGFANPVVLLWPDEQTHGSYRGLIAWFALLVVLDLIALAILPPLFVTFMVAIMPLVALTLSRAWLRLSHWQTAPLVRHLSLRRRYTLASALFLILAAVMPCTTFFRMAFDYEMGLMARYEMAALMRHLCGIKTAALPERHRGDAYIQHRIRSAIELGVYSCAALRWKATDPGADVQCPFPVRYSWMRNVGNPSTSISAWPAPVKRWFPGLYDAHAQDRFGAANSVDPRMEFVEDDGRLMLASKVSDLPDLRAEPLFAAPSLWAVAGFILMIGLIGVWMHFLNRRLFLFDLGNALSLSHPEPVPRAPVPDANLLVLVSPCDDQSMTWNQRPDLREVDLASQTAASDLKDAQAAGPGLRIVLNHFEHRIENPDVLEERIRLIEGLTCQRRVIVISAVDPLYYLSNLLTDPNSAKLITRLNAALSGFTHRTVFKQEAVSSTTKARATHG